MTPSLSRLWENKSCVTPVAEILQGVWGCQDVRGEWFWHLVQCYHRWVFSRDAVCSSGSNRTERMHPDLLTLVEICGSAHWTSCECKQGLKPPLPVKRRVIFFKGTFIYWIQAWLALDVWGLKPPGGPPASVLVACSSSEPILANFKEFTSKAFGRRRTAQAEVVVSSFSRASKALASWGVLFYFPVTHSVQSKTQSALMRGMEGGIHPSLELVEKEGKAGERYMRPDLAEQRSLKFSGERNSILVPCLFWTLGFSL